MFLGSEVRRVRRADNITAIYETIVDSVGSLTSYNSTGFQGLLRGWFTFYLNKLQTF
jgi:hypothetical protein